jgi:MORN repeat variant
MQRNYTPSTSQICILLCLAFCACKNEAKEIQIGDEKVKGDIQIKSGDTIYNGLIKYFDSTNNLTEQALFQNNQRHGASSTYYPNGHIRQLTEYERGYQKGEVLFYDSMGNILQRSYKYFDVDLGPIAWYKNGTLKAYRFSTFEGIQIYRVDYDDTGKMVESGKCLRYVTSVLKQDDEVRLGVFLYLISPPGKDLTYKIFKTKVHGTDTSLIKTCRADADPFLNFDLLMPGKDYKYFFKVEAFYPSTGLTDKNILKANEMDMVMPGASE